MKNKPWRRDIGFYSFTVELPTRSSDVDTERHINNVAVQTLHAEARVRLHLALFDRQTWLANSYALRTAGLETDFLQVTHYPASVVAGVALIRLETQGYTLATGLFQDGICVGIQECRTGCWQAGEWRDLPLTVHERLREFGVVKDAQ
jgi:acyl-CoA thioesterase FadM